MRHVDVTALGSAYQSLFGILRDAGFELAVEDFAPRSFGNFIVLCRGDEAELRVINDRGQIFIDVKTGTGEWRDKETILESNGIPRARFETVNGLWTGYEPTIQASDLQRHLPLLIEVASSGAA